MSTPKKDNLERAKNYYYHCLYCHWNTLSIDIFGDSLNNLLLKFNYYKGRYQRSPQAMMFEKLMELYKYNQEKHV